MYVCMWKGRVDGNSVVAVEGVGHKCFTERTCGVGGGGGRSESNNGEIRSMEERLGQGSEITAKEKKKIIS